MTADAAVNSATNQKSNEVVQKTIGEISHIATLPEVTLKIIKLVEDHDSTSQNLNKVISNDPALGAHTLKVVNGAFYGLPCQIGSINRAIVLLGLNAVKNIAIAASLAKLFRGGEICPNFNAKDLWTHSIGVPAATKQLAHKVGLGLPDEAFLAGLIHDLGIMVEVQARRAKLVELFEKMTNDPSITMREAEREILGASHEKFGTGLCKQWKFPSNLVYVTGVHHRPLELAPEHRTLTSLVHMADIIAAKTQTGFTRSVEPLEVHPQILEEMKLTAAVIDEIAESLPDLIAQSY